MIGVGDEVVCLKGGLRTVAGRVYRVSDISAPGQVHEGHIHVGEGLLLRFAGVSHPRGAWADAHRFRKIQHDKREACESEFVKLLNRTKKEVSA